MSASQIEEMYGNVSQATSDEAKLRAILAPAGVEQIALDDDSKGAYKEVLQAYFGGSQATETELDTMHMVVYQDDAGDFIYDVEGEKGAHLMGKGSSPEAVLNVLREFSNLDIYPTDDPRKN